MLMGNPRYNNWEDPFPCPCKSRNMPPSKLAPKSKVESSVGPFCRKKYQTAFRLENSDNAEKIVCSSNGKFCFVSTESNNTLVNCLEWTAHSVKFESNFKVLSACFRQDSKLLALCCADENIRILDTSSRRVLSSFSVKDLPIFAEFLKNSSDLLVVTKEQILLLDTMGNIRERCNLSFTCMDARISGFGVYLLANDKVCFTSTDNLDVQDVYHTSNAARFCISGNSQLAVENDGLVEIFDLIDKKLVTQLRPHLKSICFMNLSENGRLLYTASLDGILSVTDILSTKSQIIYKSKSPIVQVYQLEDRQFVIGTNDGFVTFYQEKEKAKSKPVSRAADSVERKVDQSLKKFEYGKALEAAVFSGSIDVVAALVEKLQYCNVLRRCIDGASEECIRQLQSLVISCLQKGKRLSFASNVLSFIFKDASFNYPGNFHQVKECVESVYFIQSSLIALGSQLEIADFLK